MIATNSTSSHLAPRAIAGTGRNHDRTGRYLIPRATSGYKKINYLPLTPALAKVGVDGSNPFARSNMTMTYRIYCLVGV